MDIDEEDDFYAPEEPEVDTSAAPAPSAAPPAQATAASATAAATTETKDSTEDLEEGEEEDEGGAMDDDDDDESDIDIITERKDGTRAAPPSQSRYSDIRNIPQRTPGDGSKTAAPAKKDDGSKPDSAYPPAVSTSQIDVNAIPTHKATGKPITQVNIDEDLPDYDKPWRRPGTDISDYFNYGFDEFTWALYAQKQEALRADYSQDAVAQKNTKMMEDLNNMFMMGGAMPGMGPPGMAMPGPGGGGGGGPPGGGGGAAGGVPGAAGGAGPGAVGGGGGGVGGGGNANIGANQGSGGGGGGGGMSAPGALDGMPPEMQQFMQQLLASGIDPGQIDPATMAGMMAQVGAGGQGGPGGGNPGFGGSPGFGAGGQGGGGYGYDPSMGAGGVGSNGNRGGGFGGRGRGGRRNW